MKKGISRWAFPASMGLGDCLDLAKRAGFDGVELVIGAEGELTLESGEGEFREAARAASRAGVEVCSLATGLFWDHSLTSDDPQERERAKAVAEKMIEAASWLGTDAILVVPGAVDVFFKPGSPVVPYDLAYQRALQALRGLAPLAEARGVTICVENVWNRLLLSPLEVRRFLDEVGSRRVGAYLDVGNAMLTGYPEQWIKILGERVKRIHLKDYRRSVGTVEGFVPLLHGDVDWPQVISALREVGYDGYLTAEVFPTRFHPEAQIWTTSKSIDFILGRR